MKQGKKVLKKLTQTHAPKGMKYCLTMVPMEGELSLEKILKEKRKRATANSDTEKPAKRFKLPMEADVVTNTDLEEKIRKREEEDRMKRTKHQRRKKNRGC